MIVVDTNVLVYLYLPTEYSDSAEKLLLKDAKWVVPLLWRSEFRSVLALYMRKKLLTFEQACVIQNEAEELLAGSEYEVPSLDVLKLVASSECSAYDCEFVALARKLGIKLVTQDKKIISQFSEFALSLNDAV